MSFTVLIPARLASTRLPNKPLADIGGAPMIVRVAQAALRSGANQVVVACDDASIQTACEKHGIKAVLTKVDHPSGSDRLAEACDKLSLADDAIVANVQGDEPLIDPRLIDEVANLLKNRPLAGMGTAAHAIESVADQSNPNIVKVVLDAQNHALYFSRSLIPFNRDGHAGAPKPLRHVGIYSYRAGFLRQFPKLPQAPIEVSESLEQLRALWHGHKIAVHVSEAAPGPGVDTPEDLERVRKLWASTIG
ncbi:3-deoxy-manno-octulosonate cytidylyltransferase [Variovorax sp. PCZ-1]|uniref:3-deoxy-manno-octulosonate cytidylyltransferase n=1 Tax=Variovorax sp. PCZ-1 TaxID=2835533 RepID=UPI001BD16523|nr:3-deoxy-manno-octulosonate cytidylyltransferase [Variovorax sp. PCZ-1]MBS7808354.1 3-deoxy-manno-octulosonate cytidylyltransferase [Variovorax sp. PCZ-1]